MKIRGPKPCSLFLLFALSLVTPVLAQEQRAPVTTRHSLWKVEGKKNTVYLLGSIHVLKKEDYPLPAPIEAAFTNAQIAVFETDIDAAKDPAFALKMQSKSMLPEGETIETQLSPEVYSNYLAYVKEVGLPAPLLEKFKPSMAATFVLVFELQKLGLDPSYGLDQHFFERARKEGKQTVALEPVEFQLDLITGFSKEEGELFMKTMLKDAGNLKNEIGDLMKAWQSGDGDKLAKLLNEATEEAPILYKRLLTDRNRSWLPKIEELSRGDKNAIVIVGAGHLVGKESVVDLLKSKGFKINQL